MYIDLQTYSVQTLEHLLRRFKVGLWTSYSYQIGYVGVCTSNDLIRTSHF